MCTSCENAKTFNVAMKKYVPAPSCMNPWVSMKVDLCHEEVDLYENGKNYYVNGWTYRAEPMNEAELDFWVKEGIKPGSWLRRSGEANYLKPLFGDMCGVLPHEELWEDYEDKQEIYYSSF